MLMTSNREQLSTVSTAAGTGVFPPELWERWAAATGCRQLKKRGAGQGKKGGGRFFVTRFFNDLANTAGFVLLFLPKGQGTFRQKTL